MKSASFDAAQTPNAYQYALRSECLSIINQKLTLKTTRIVMA